MVSSPAASSSAAASAAVEDRTNVHSEAPVPLADQRQQNQQRTGTTGTTGGLNVHKSTSSTSVTPTTTDEKHHHTKKLQKKNNNNNNRAAESLAAQSLRQTQLKDKQLAAKEMLLLHATGSVKVGEVIRYTITYHPTQDRIYPPPRAIHIRIKNTEPIAMRAAYLHGPYVLYVSAKNSKYNQWTPVTDWKESGGYPEFEPSLRPGGSWECMLPLPRKVRDRAMAEESTRQAASDGGGSGVPLVPRVGDAVGLDSITWTIEVASQMIFSSSSKISFDLLVARDEKSLAQFSSQGVMDEGSFSNAVTFKVQNTEQLWNTPPFPGQVEEVEPESTKKPKKNKGPKKVHLVMITHGLHSNTGADMLYLKENIDRAAARAIESVRKRRREGKKKEKEMMAQRKSMEEEAHEHDKESELTRRLSHVEELSESTLQDEDLKPTTTVDHKLGPADSETEHETEEEEESDSEDEEQVITRGFHDNVCRTERGIKYLGKRLARYVLAVTYPNRPFPPSLRDKKEAHKSGAFPLHLHHNREEKKAPKEKQPPAKYKVTSISFIGHSLGGLVQTYAIAYIHAHSPTFFKEVEPVNFIALASPFLGLSNENPIYIRFALDFGVVGKTGQDLGLSWRAPNAFSAFSTAAANPKENEMAGTKPLLRILPTGPAKEVLHMFRNRTVYANVVNDGIVPLRTSCLLFLDWKGLGRVEKARRQAEGPVGQVSGLVGWGWGQLISGQGERTHKRSWSVSSGKSASKVKHEPPTAAVGEAPRTDERPKSGSSSNSGDSGKKHGNHPAPNPLSALLTLFRPHAAKKKAAIYQRSQIIPSPTFPPGTESPVSPGAARAPPSPGPVVVDRNLTRSPDKLIGPATAAGAEVDEMDPNKNHLGEAEDEMEAPPRTTLLEAAGDVLNPPLPSLDYLINPAARPRTIFHDRVYHPEDIPPMPLRTRRTLSRAGSSFGPLPPVPGKDSPPGSTNATNESLNTTSSSSSGASSHNTRSNMRPEEKIARAYHEGLSWRKVLVRLEPDAHNNIIVRREFSNAYGWPVVKHLCDTHFEDTFESRMRDEDEGGEERAFEIGDGWKGNEEVTHGDGIKTPTAVPSMAVGEATDGNVSITPPPKDASVVVSDGEDEPRFRFRRRPSGLKPGTKRTLSFKRNRSTSPTNPMDDSGVWSDSAFNVSDEEDEEEEQKRDEERRRLKQIDSFLGKNKSKPAEASITPVSGSGGNIHQGQATKVGLDLGSIIGYDSGEHTAVEKLTRLHSREQMRRSSVEDLVPTGEPVEEEEGIAQKIARLSYSSPGKGK